MDPGGLRRRCRRSSGWRPGSAATCGDPARFAADWDLLVQRSARRRRPARDHRDRPRRSRSRRSRAALPQDPPATRGTSPTTPGRGSPTTPSTPTHDPHLTGDEARAIDSAIDAYNETIIASVGAPPAPTVSTGTSSTWARCSTGSPPAATSTARGRGPPGGRPTSCRHRCWPWTRCRTPGSSGPGRRAALTAASSPSTASTPPPSPTASSPRRSSRSWNWPASASWPGRQPRAGPVTVDFDRLLRADTLLSRPPASVTNTLSLLGWLDDRLDWVRRLLPFA